MKKHMIRTGEFVSQYVKSVDGSDVKEDRIQPNGVDLSIEGIYAMIGHPGLTDGEYNMPDRKLVATEFHDGYGDVYNLPFGPYIVEYNEIITIPDGHVGFVLPRSRLPRCGLFLTTAVWDQGYSGRGEGLLMNWMEMSHIVSDVAIGQIVMMTAEEPSDKYDGKHQNERMDFGGGKADDEVEEMVIDYLKDNGPTDKQHLLTSILIEGNVSGKSINRVISKSDNFAIDDSERVHLTGGD